MLRSSIICLTIFCGHYVYADSPTHPYNAHPSHVAHPTYRDGYHPVRWHARSVVTHRLHGVADVIRADGERNLLNSAAAINGQQARSMKIENDVAAAAAYYHRRHLRDTAVRSRKVPMTMAKARRIAASAGPKRLGPEQLDPNTGQILWPVLLQDDSLSSVRQQIAKRFAAIAQTSTDQSIPGSVYKEVQVLCSQLDGYLNNNLDQLPIGEAARAKAFLRSLSHEAKLATS